MIRRLSFENVVELFPVKSAARARIRIPKQAMPMAGLEGIEMGTEEWRRNFDADAFKASQAVIRDSGTEGPSLANMPVTLAQAAFAGSWAMFKAIMKRQ